MALPPDRCVICTQFLPLPALDGIARGGRPRLTCSRRCKRVRDIRVRAINRVTAWARRAAERGDLTRAQAWQARAEALADTMR